MAISHTATKQANLKRDKKYVTHELPHSPILGKNSWSLVLRHPPRSSHDQEYVTNRKCVLYDGGCFGTDSTGSDVEEVIAEVVLVVLLKEVKAALCTGNKIFSFLSSLRSCFLSMRSVFTNSNVQTAGTYLASDVGITEEDDASGPGLTPTVFVIGTASGISEFNPDTI